MSTIIIRGSTDNIMDDIERAIDDGVNSVKVLTRDQRCLPGAAATEIELAKQLMSYGEQVLWEGELHWGRGRGRRLGRRLLGRRRGLGEGGGGVW